MIYNIILGVQGVQVQPGVQVNKYKLYLYMEYKSNSLMGRKLNF